MQYLHRWAFQSNTEEGLHSVVQYLISNKKIIKQIKEWEVGQNNSRRSMCYSLATAVCHSNTSFSYLVIVSHTNDEQEVSLGHSELKPLCFLDVRDSSYIIWGDVIGITCCMSLYSRPVPIVNAWVVVVVIEEFWL